MANSNSGMEMMVIDSIIINSGKALARIDKGKCNIFWKPIAWVSKKMYKHYSEMLSTVGIILPTVDKTQQKIEIVKPSKFFNYECCSCEALRKDYETWMNVAFTDKYWEVR